MDKRKKILLVLLVVFLIILIFRIMNPYTQKRVSKLTNTGKRKQAALKTVYTSGKEEPVEISSVMLNLLSNPPRHSGTMHKNIFFKENHNIISLCSRCLYSKTPTKKLPHRFPQHMNF